MIGLTAKQKQFYDFIARYIAAKGYAPSYDEMAEALGHVSKGHVAQFIAILEERGWVRRLPHRARAIEIVAPSVTLNSEIAALTDRYAAEHGLSRDTAANELLRAALEAA